MTVLRLCQARLQATAGAWSSSSRTSDQPTSILATATPFLLRSCFRPDGKTPLRGGWPVQETGIEAGSVQPRGMMCRISFHPSKCGSDARGTKGTFTGSRIVKKNCPPCHLLFSV